jgi:hypothetical protein
MKTSTRLVSAMHAFTRACMVTIATLLATLAAWGAALPPF